MHGLPRTRSAIVVRWFLAHNTGLPAKDKELKGLSPRNRRTLATASPLIVLAMNRDNPAAGIRGRSLDVEPIDELEHYGICPECGQAFDMRELAEVFHHEEEGHQRLPTH